jgi:heme-degrading monooxygenase HmoA
MLVFLSYITVAASDVDTYACARRSIMYPAMRDAQGYGGLALLRPRVDSDTARLALLNWWASAEDQQRWASSAAHGAMKTNTNHLVRSAVSSVYEQADELSLTIDGPASPTMFSIGYHRVVAGHGTDYISARRDVANPRMRMAPGFVGISVCTEPGDVDSFVTLLEWADDSAADEYYASAEHADVVVPAIAAVLTSLEPSKRYDILMRDTPSSS